MTDHTIRATGSLVIWAFGVLVGVAALVDVASGDLSGFWHAVGPVLLALWVLGMLLAWPVIRYGREGIEIVNPGVVTRAPWSAVASVDRGLQLMVTFHDGRRVAAWGSPSLPRQRPRKVAVDDRDWSLTQLQSAWHGGRDTHAGGSIAVVRRLDWPVLVLGAVLAIATILGLAL